MSSILNTSVHQHTHPMEMKFKLKYKMVQHSKNLQVDYPKLELKIPDDDETYRQHKQVMLLSWIGRCFFLIKSLVGSFLSRSRPLTRRWWTTALVKIIIKLVYMKSLDMDTVWITHPRVGVRQGLKKKKIVKGPVISLIDGTFCSTILRTSPGLRPWV